MRNKDWIKRDRNSSYLSFAEMYPAGYRYKSCHDEDQGRYLYLCYV